MISEKIESQGRLVFFFSSDFIIFYTLKLLIGIFNSSLKLWNTQCKKEKRKGFSDNVKFITEKV